MSENYIMLNGKRIELTDEQIEKLGLKTEKKDCFSRQPRYYYILEDGVVIDRADNRDRIDNRCYDVGNYCTDEAFMQQRALHETLNRLLWRFSMQNDGDKIDWSKETTKYYIYFQSTNNKFYIDYTCCLKQLDIYFKSRESAQRAIDEIIKPFMKEHPDFIW